MNEQSNIDLVRHGYDCYAKGDIQQLLGLFAQDIEWTLPEIEGIPYTGKRRGTQQVAEFFSTMDQLQEARVFQPDEFIAQGDKVIVLGHCTFSVKATGVEYSDEWTHVFTIRNGKIAKFKEYGDTHAAALAYQPQAGVAARGAATGARPPVH